MPPIPEPTSVPRLPREHFFPQFPVIREKNSEMFEFFHLNFSKRH